MISYGFGHGMESSMIPLYCVPFGLVWSDLFCLWSSRRACMFHSWITSLHVLEAR